MRGECLEGAVDVRHVARVLTVLLRRVHTDEVDVAELRDLGEVHGEAQPPGGPLDPGDVLAQQLLETGLVHRDLAPLEHLDLLGHDVETEHLETELGHGRGVCGAEIAGADHGDLEGHGCSRVQRPWVRCPSIVGACPAASPGNFPLSPSSRMRPVGRPLKFGLLNGN
ncbi:hypothetical protein SAV31267_041450 [Streptomyces avermitilis]|uniref:Uncharacterized protein n=1 Tax=Streptomyces avermitilis TaxID=33903 RepID=A0A4D4MR71_STRAX|nr:hypothetical protein SAV31267_041450 [Streptomyces avermitilis]